MVTPAATIAVNSGSSATSNCTSTSASIDSPSCCIGSGTSRVHSTTLVASGSPEATPRVKGSEAKMAPGLAFGVTDGIASAVGVAGGGVAVGSATAFCAGVAVGSGVAVGDVGVSAAAPVSVAAALLSTLPGSFDPRAQALNIAVTKAPAKTSRRVYVPPAIAPFFQPAVTSALRAM